MGSAVALGLAELGSRVLMLDRSSVVQRASRANFGLILSQRKGVNHAAYRQLSIDAVRASRTFGEELAQTTGIDLELRLGAGMILAIGAEELNARRAMVDQLQRQTSQHPDWAVPQLVDRRDVQAMLGSVRLGDNVSGGSYSDIDGDINPLLLLRAMRRAFLQNGGQFRQNCTVHGLCRRRRHWRVDATAGKIETPIVVLAAGLGSADLAAGLGISIPVVPQKGQLLVTERLAPFLPFPMSGIRQTGNGTVMIGYTQENTGFEVTTATSAAVYLAQRALAAFPGLKHARIIRTWAGLRVLTQDGLPIYDMPDDRLFVLATHSCVTLAALHATLLPPWILGGPKPDNIQCFDLERFNVSP